MDATIHILATILLGVFLVAGIFVGFTIIAVIGKFLVDIITGKEDI